MFVSDHYTSERTRREEKEEKVTQLFILSIPRSGGASPAGTATRHYAFDRHVFVEIGPVYSVAVVKKLEVRALFRRAV